MFPLCLKAATPRFGTRMASQPNRNRYPRPRPHELSRHPTPGADRSFAKFHPDLLRNLTDVQAFSFLGHSQSKIGTVGLPLAKVSPSIRFVGRSKPIRLDNNARIEANYTDDCVRSPAPLAQGLWLADCLALLE